MGRSFHIDLSRETTDPQTAKAIRNWKLSYRQRARLISQIWSFFTGSRGGARLPCAEFLIFCPPQAQNLRAKMQEKQQKMVTDRRYCLFLWLLFIEIVSIDRHSPRLQQWKWFTAICQSCGNHGLDATLSRTSVTGLPATSCTKIGFDSGSDIESDRDYNSCSRNILKTTVKIWLLQTIKNCMTQCFLFYP